MSVAAGTKARRDGNPPASLSPYLPPLRSPSLFLTPSRLCALPLSHRSLPPTACHLPSGGSQLPRLLHRQHSYPTTKVSSVPWPSSPSLSPLSSSLATIALTCVANSVSPSLPTPSIDVSSPPSLFPPFASHHRPALRRPQRLSLSPHPPSVDVSSPLSPALPSLPLSSLLFASHHSPSPASPTACHLPSGGSFSSKLAVFRPSLPPFFPTALLRAATDRLFLSSSRQLAAIRTSFKNLPPFPCSPPKISHLRRGHPRDSSPSPANDTSSCPLPTLKRSYYFTGLVYFFIFSNGCK